MARKEKFDYFEAFENQADLAVKEAELLVELFNDADFASKILDYEQRAHEIEHQGDQICHSLYRALAADFITPLERDDILALAQNLDDCLDFMEGTVQRIYMYNVDTIHPAAAEFSGLLLKSCKALAEGVREFRDYKHPKKLEDIVIQVNDIEEEADVLFMNAIRGLFSEKADDPVYVLVWDKIIHRLEHTADACEHVSDLMGTIAMKNA